MNTLSIEVQSDGIALILLDNPDRSVNVVSSVFVDEFIKSIDQVENDESVRGAVVASNKDAFMAGADLEELLGLMDRGITAQEAFAFSQRVSVEMHRKLETCGKPFVAAINGYALGGGYELCLACHCRVIVDDPKAKVGLPEVGVGLLPGSGGTQRLPRMIGIESSLPFLVEGKALPPQQALEKGLVDVVVAPDKLIEKAKECLLTVDPIRDWDKKGYSWIGGAGLLNSGQAAIYSSYAASLAAKFKHNYPAPITILECVFEGALMPFDKALTVESKAFAKLVTNPVSRNIIRTAFVNKKKADQLARRPESVPTSKVTKVGVLGAGLMGSGISYVTARSGIDVILLDTTIEQAEKGRQYASKVLDRAVAKGRFSRHEADAVFARIAPTTDYGRLAGCDVVVEAVFEDRKVKAKVTAYAESAVGRDAVFASNTSTLPITGLAESSSRPEQFIGLHFFSPVEKMPLVEVISGQKTSEETLAKSMDFVAQLRMTPIVVNDGRGFYTSRVFQTFIHEGMAMLDDGVEPARIENVARMAGMPMGPLALLDDVTIALPWKIVQQSIQDIGEDYTRPCSYGVMQKMVEDLGRSGRSSGAGFYEYPDRGKRYLWPGLRDVFPIADRQTDTEELKKRILYIQALETARCLEENVLTHPADGDVGSVLAWGFPIWTGGTLTLIETVGLQTFVDECDRMAKMYGSRFEPSAWLKDRSRRGTPFYLGN